MKKKVSSSYLEKLKDPRWQRRRLQIMDLHNFECSSCGDKTKTLHVHHKAYKKNAEPWEYQDHELDCICEDCHEYETFLDKYLEESLYQFKTDFCNSPNKLTLIGFIEGQLLGSGPGHEKIKVLSWEHAHGIGLGLEYNGKGYAGDAIISILEDKYLFRWAYEWKYKNQDHRIEMILNKLKENKAEFKSDLEIGYWEDSVYWPKELIEKINLILTNDS